MTSARERRRPCCAGPRSRSARRTARLPAATTARRLFRRSCRASSRDLGVELCGGTTRLTRPQSSAVARVDELAGEQHLERALARHVARRPARPASSRRSPRLTPDVANFAAVGGDREVALRDELAAGGRRCALHARDHRLRQRRDASASCGCSGRTAPRSSAAPSRADLLQVVPGAEALPAPARTTTRMLPSSAIASNAACSASSISHRSAG